MVKEEEDNQPENPPKCFYKWKGKPIYFYSPPKKIKFSINCLFLLFFLIIYLATPCGCGILVPRPRIEPRPQQWSAKS